MIQFIDIFCNYKPDLENNRQVQKPEFSLDRSQNLSDFHFLAELEIIFCNIYLLCTQDLKRAHREHTSFENKIDQGKMVQTREKIPKTDEEGRISSFFVEFFHSRSIF